jgi:hypothetical protein
MALTKNVLKKFEKEGITVTSPRPGNYVARFPAANVQIIDQDGEAISFYVIRHGRQDDHMTDYFAGKFVDNAKQAIEFARGMER